MRYLLDSDALIAAKSLYYKPSYCGRFWSWLDECHTAGAICSIDKVRDELLNGNDDDPLVAWARAKETDGFFLPTTGVMGNFAAITTWATTRQPAFTRAALDKFLRADAADAWLVAYAAHHDGQFTIVTNETSAPQSKHAVKLPDAARALSVDTINMFDLLDLFAHSDFAFRVN